VGLRPSLGSNTGEATGTILKCRCRRDVPISSRLDLLVGVASQSNGQRNGERKKTSRGRKQDRALVAGGQDYEVRYEARKSRRSKPAVKKAVKKVGNSRKKVERRLAR